jgi:hypothetical protein
MYIGDALIMRKDTPNICFREQYLQLAIDQDESNTEQVKYIGLIITIDGVGVDPVISSPLSETGRC